MFKRFARHFAFHLLWWVVAIPAGFLGVFLVGVPVMGDNPGAIFGGLLTFWATYWGLVWLQALFIDRRGIWSAFLQPGFSFLEMIAGGYTLNLVRLPGPPWMMEFTLATFSFFLFVVAYEFLFFEVERSLRRFAPNALD